MAASPGESVPDSPVGQLFVGSMVRLQPYENKPAMIRTLTDTYAIETLVRKGVARLSWALLESCDGSGSEGGDAEATVVLDAIGTDLPHFQHRIAAPAWRSSA